MAFGWQGVVDCCGQWSKVVAITSGMLEKGTQTLLPCPGEIVASQPWPINWGRWLT